VLPIPPTHTKFKIIGHEGKGREYKNEFHKYIYPYVSTAS
jgi:hypothetical protein